MLSRRSTVSWTNAGNVSDCQFYFCKLLKLPTPKQGFAPWKFNISANKIVLYAIATSGWSALRRYSGNLASKSTVKAVSCLSLSFKISWRLAIKASIRMASDLAESNVCHFINEKEEQLTKSSLIFVLALFHCKQHISGKYNGRMGCL